ncbi:hypothetical protein NL676_015340 [Syzygium grande]|nr:hypothetical protein NL676_015340 [Syzygium grande]
MGRGRAAGALGYGRLKFEMELTCRCSRAADFEASQDTLFTDCLLQFYRECGVYDTNRSSFLLGDDWLPRSMSRTSGLITVQLQNGD